LLYTILLFSPSFSSSSVLSSSPQSSSLPLIHLLFCSPLIYSFFSSIPPIPFLILFLFSSTIPIFILYLSVLTYTYLYSLTFQTIWPRTFYRSGWLRCDVFNSWESCLCFELMGVIGVWVWL
jgi:hypothetical protein